MKKLIALICIITFSQACITTPENTNIPYASVYFSINVAPSGMHNTLASGNVGNALEFSKNHPSLLTSDGKYGYGGVVVTRGTDDKLYAFDLCCTYEVDKDITLEIDGFVLRCPVCGSQFYIADGGGYPTSGPATQSLKKYEVRNYDNRECQVIN